jgi:predicted nucleic acid-binding protein
VSSAPLRSVLDASVAVKVFVPETHSAAARELLTRFTREDEAELVVPNLFFVECANVFWKLGAKVGLPVRGRQGTSA